MSMGKKSSKKSASLTSFNLSAVFKGSCEYDKLNK